MFIENLIFPRVCFICGKKIFEKQTYTCENCSNILKYMWDEKICQYKNAYFDKLVSVFQYQGMIRNKILSFKFNNKTYLGKAFAYYISFLLKNENIFFDLIIPVPIHYKRFFERGYNQSIILAQNISKSFNIKCETKILLKIFNSKAQSLLKLKDRRNNVLNTYKVKNKSKVLGKTILLVDDIFTTGATTNECSKVLKQNGAKSVVVATISYVRRSFDG